MIVLSPSLALLVYLLHFQVPFRLLFIIPPCPSRNTHSIRVFVIDIQPELYTYEYTLVDYYHNNTMIFRNPTLYIYTAPSAIPKYSMI